MICWGGERDGDRLVFLLLASHCCLLLRWGNGEGIVLLVGDCDKFVPAAASISDLL